MKKNGKISKVEAADSGRETRVLLEDIRQQVKIVAEGHGTIIKNLEDHGKRLDSMSSDISDLKEDISIMKPALERNCKDMLEVKNDLQELKKDMREVKSELGSVKMVVVNISHEINEHEKRIKKVEEKVLI